MKIHLLQAQAGTNIYGYIFFALLIIVPVIIIYAINKSLKKKGSSIKDKLSILIKKPAYLLIPSGLALFLMLSFHFVYDGNEFHFLAKDNLTFKDTFIGERDIEMIINRYNEANVLDKVEMRKESLHKKLHEEGILGWVEKDKSK
ncbi:MAG: hypothetical protein ACKOXB_10170 [Flavobacteriales bacterium]